MIFFMFPFIIISIIGIIICSMMCYEQYEQGDLISFMCFLVYVLMFVGILIVSLLGLFVWG